MDLDQFVKQSSKGRKCSVCNLPAAALAQVNTALRTQGAPRSVVAAWTESEGFPVTVPALNYHIANNHDA